MTEGLPKVQADAQKTIWVLVNLISNAIRYTGSDGQITLEAQRNENTQFVQFAVKDTEEGIADEDLYKIFEKYYQVDKDRKDRSGSGLGLSIAKEFIMARVVKFGPRASPARAAAVTTVTERAAAAGKANSR